MLRFRQITSGPKLVERFSRFGKLKSAEIIQSRQHARQYAYVTYVRATDAYKALMHFRSSVLLEKVIAAHSWLQPDYQTSQQDVKDVEFVISNEMIDDHCLSEVFKKMDITTLCTAAEVSKRFNIIAQPIIRKHSFVRNFVFDCDFTSPHRWTLLRTRQILRHIGPYLKDMTLMVSMDDDSTSYRYLSQVFRKLIQYTSPALETLHLVDYESTRVLNRRLAPLLAQLKTLKITFTPITDAFDIGEDLVDLSYVSHCKNLQQLEILCDEKVEVMDFEGHWPNLKAVSLSIDDGFEVLTTLMKGHQHLKILEFSTFVDGFEGIPEKIPMNLPALEEITIFEHELLIEASQLRNLLDLQTLRTFALKNLKKRNRPEMLALWSVVQEMRSVQHLTLEQSEPHQHLSSLNLVTLAKNLRDLKTVRFYGMELGSQALGKFVAVAKQIESINLHGSSGFIVDSCLLNDILQTRRFSCEPLELTVCKSVCDWDEIQSVSRNRSSSPQFFSPLLSTDVSLTFIPQILCSPITKSRLALKPVSSEMFCCRNCQKAAKK